jgi:hypothetical protein
MRFTVKYAKPLIFLTSVFILSNLIDEIQISHNRSVMSDKKLLTLRKYSHISAMILAAAAFLSSGKEAAALTAEEVLNRMSDEERFAYISGVVDGLAFARWTADQPDNTGMQCIYDWYYGGNAAVRETIQTWLTRHQDRPVDALMYVLIRRECGE